MFGTPNGDTQSDLTTTTTQKAMKTTATIFFILMTASAVHAQSSPQTPEDGQTYYIYNTGRNAWLTAMPDGSVKLGGSGTAVTLTSTGDVAGTFYMTVPQGRITASTHDGLSSDGSGQYDRWLIRPSEDGKAEGACRVAYLNRESNAFTYIYGGENGEVTQDTYMPDALYADGGWKLVAESGYEENTVLFDENATEYNEPYDSEVGVKVRLRRTLSSRGWNTLCLPFDMNSAQVRSVFGEGTLIAAFTSCDGTTMHFTYTDCITAGTPYLINPKNSTPESGFYEIDGVTSFAQKPLDVEHDGVFMRGCFNKMDVPADAFVIGTGHKVYQLVSPMESKGFRCYITDGTAGSKLNAWAIDDGTTGIEGTLTSDGEPGEVFTIDGKSTGKNSDDTDGMTPGVYVTDGKKVVIK